ncbi:MAG: RES family NAD+ phosphorylase, partial [Burkholderiaceae bacterium]|nr:RES family NAD+ phosphorylase [Burkholderiaceae bacterium]
MHAFRMVETQHIAATMRLVDSAAEQDVLEHMLDASKPPLPPEAQGIHYLLAAPFRYLPPTGSRFRSTHMPGIWYGADDSYCACAEIAYWRQRFLLDSAGLITQHLSTDHSLYEAAVQGRAI